MKCLLYTYRTHYFIFCRGEWKAWAPTWMCGPGLSGSTVGIVGLGRIGQRVGECLKSFNVDRILYTSRTAKSEASKFQGEKVEFDELLRDSDFVVVAAALTPETRHIFNAGAFKQMKRTAIFVNGSRGEVVDQTALLDALKNRTIAAAGLDVMTPEPIPLNSELLKLDNCGRYLLACAQNVREIIQYCRNVLRRDTQLSVLSF